MQKEDEMTIDEARKKLCPIISDGQEDKNCLTTQCMAWEATDTEEKSGHCKLIDKEGK